MFLKNFISFYYIYFFVYSLLLCYVFRTKTPKLFGVILQSLQRAIEHCFKYAERDIVDCATLRPIKF